MSEGVDIIRAIVIYTHEVSPYKSPKTNPRIKVSHWHNYVDFPTWENEIQGVKNMDHDTFHGIQLRNWK